MYKILTLNNISVAGLNRLPRENYEVASEIAHPDAIMVRSANMHEMEIPPTVRAIGRAGAGVNNIPVERMSQRGVPVFNAPGANANAVKELVLAGMLIAARNIAQAWDFARAQSGDDEAIHQAVERGKKQFVGFELPGRTVGVVGLGAIGVRVANMASGLGMRVIGYDPTITVQRAWQLESNVEAASSLDDLVSRSDFITFHVPLTDETRHSIDAVRLKRVKEGAVLLNFSRAGIIDDQAAVEALNEGRLYAYVCDFPTNLLKNHPRVVTLPHIGASTREAEENCAMMVADQLREWLEDGNVQHSVNFPTIQLPRNGEGHRLVVVNRNVPNMVGQISTHLAAVELNILDMLNRSRNQLAVTLIDVDQEPPVQTLEGIRSIEGVLAVHPLAN